MLVQDRLQTAEAKVSSLSDELERLRVENVSKRSVLCRLLYTCVLPGPKLEHVEHPVNAGGATASEAGTTCASA